MVTVQGMQSMRSPIWKNFKGGWRTLGDPINFDRNESPDLGNMIASEKGAIGRRKGANLIMNQANAHPGKKVTMLHTYTKTDGTKHTLVAYDGYVKLLNLVSGAVTDLPTPIGSHSETGMYCAAKGNDELYFCNGVDNMVKFDGTANTSITLTNIGGNAFVTNAFAFRDRKMFAVDAGDRNLMHRSKTDGGTATDIVTFNYSSGSVIENSGTSKIVEGGDLISINDYQNKLFIFSENTIFTSDWSSIGSETLFVTTPYARDVGSVTRLSTVSVGKSLIYFDPIDQSLRQFGMINDNPSPQVGDTTDAIRNTMQEELDFSESASVYWNRLVLTACKTSSEEPANNLVLLYDLESNAVFPLYGWYVSCWMVDDGKLYFGSSTAAQVFQAFEGYTDGGAEIDFWYEFNIDDFDDPTSYKNGSYLYMDGVIDEQVKTNITIKFDYGTQVLTKTIDGSNSEYVIDTNVQGYLGESERGVVPLGGVMSASDRTYAVWIRVNARKFRNVQILIEKGEQCGPGAFTVRQCQFVGLVKETGQPPDARIL